MFKFLLVDTSPHFFMGNKAVSGKTIFSHNIEEYMKNSEVNHQRCMSVSLKKKVVSVILKIMAHSIKRR